jgi:hypothetical protein
VPRSQIVPLAAGGAANQLTARSPHSCRTLTAHRIRAARSPHSCRTLTAFVPEISPHKPKNAACDSHDHEDLFFDVSFLHLYDELFTSGIKSSQS